MEKWERNVKEYQHRAWFVALMLLILAGVITASYLTGYQPDHHYDPVWPTP